MFKTPSSALSSMVQTKQLRFGRRVLTPTKSRSIRKALVRFFAESRPKSKHERLTMRMVDHSPGLLLQGTNQQLNAAITMLQKLRIRYKPIHYI
jgi:hypothetical protein